ncbi:MAG TPA: DUF4336 domain-containing protein [Myxococcota bacterium]|nr:DUF4336 domain-containing protein [Myxococcota bacterium]
MAALRIRELHRDLLAIDHPLRLPGGLELGTRSCLVRLSSGGTLVHTPGPLDDEVRRAIEGLGPVRALVAPNLLHYFFLAESIAAFPQARVFAAPGLREKLGDVRVDEVLAEEPPELWAADLDQTLVGGAPRLSEFVFFHRASRTLLTLDLCFNVAASRSFVTRWFMRANGAYGRFGPSRIFRFAIAQDHRPLRTSLERILAWDFDRVTVAHGEILESGGRAALERGFAWLRA